MLRLTPVSNTTSPVFILAEPSLPIVADQIQHAPNTRWTSRCVRDFSGAIQLELFPNILSRKFNSDPIPATYSAKLFAISPNNRDKYGRNLVLDNLLENVRQFENYVSRRKITALRYHFASLTARYFELDEVTNRLRGAGIILVGDVVQLSREEVTRITGASESELAVVDKLLALHGLSLGKCIPGWAAETRYR